MPLPRPRAVAGRLPILAALAALVAVTACAAAATPPPSEAPAVAPPEAAEPHAAVRVAPEDPPRWEGAVGLLLSQGPAYAGAERRRWGARPSVYLRRGRWTFSTSGVFVNRARDDVMQGLGHDLHRGDTVRSQLSLRLQRGGRSARSENLPQAPETRDTVLGRLTTTWMPGGLERGEGWRLTLGLGTDLLGRGGGHTLDLGIGREHAVADGLRWQHGLTLSAASGAWLRQRFEVTPEEAARTGRPAFRPGGGLREVSVGAGLRWQVDRHWQLIAGVSAFRMLGPAADSPLVARRAAWSAQAGTVYSF